MTSTNLFFVLTIFNKLWKNFNGNFIRLVNNLRTNLIKASC